MAAGSTSTNGLALDARSLDALRRNAAGDPRAALKQAAGQFEALFLQQLLKSMRDAMPKSGMFDGPGRETYVAMLDQQLSQSMANRPGGLAGIIARQLERNLAPAAKTDTASNVANTANSARDAATKAAPSTLSLDPRASRALKESLEKRLDAPQAAFVDRMWPHAIAAQRTTGVPAAFVVGQAALESGWGRHEIRHADGRSAHNLFGVKATGGWNGPTVDVTTTEYVDGKPVKALEKFRAYGSYAEAFRDWASLMSTSARYGGVLREAKSPEGFAQGLQRAGYATDPDYADKLESTIQRTLRLARSGV
ncbi:MAG: flagellar assembly peptidoglycan hydrolase FlgJ [Burkholderiaceae bacterium]|nr:flagellar assembly peptidoglycan hydrolase FlgJ [Burkholderiaceae bacterium]